MRLKEIIDEDFVNYRKPSMFIGTVSCNGKCCIEAGIPISVCQNDGWRSCAPIRMADEKLCKRYVDNSITSAIVFGGLEPFEQTDEIVSVVHMLRTDFECEDDVVIYTGYKPEEIEEPLRLLKEYPNIVVKFGRYIPNRPTRYDEVLGITLVSDNQYAERIS